MIKKLLLSGFREGVGRLIVFGSYISLPKPLQRTEKEQKQVDEQCQILAIYQFYACPFCVKLRRNVHRLGLNIDYIDAQNPETKAMLLEKTGKSQVPCLRIQDGEETIFLQESDKIIEYLTQHFGKAV